MPPSEAKRGIADHVSIDIGLIARLLKFLPLIPGVAAPGVPWDVAVHPAKLVNQDGRSIEPIAAGPATVAIFELKDCPISQKYSPEIGRLIRQYPGVRFEIVLVDEDGAPAVARRHREAYHLGCPELLDPKRIFARQIGVSAVPTAAVFDARSRLRYLGRIDDRFPTLGFERAKPSRRDLNVAIGEVLGGKPVSVRQTSVVGCALPPG